MSATECVDHLPYGRCRRSLEAGHQRITWDPESAVSSEIVIPKHSTAQVLEVERMTVLYVLLNFGDNRELRVGLLTILISSVRN